MAELKVKYSGAWRNITAPEVKYSGSWRTIDSIEVKYAGSWRTVFSGAPAITVTLDQNDVSNSAGGHVIQAGVYYFTSGQEYSCTDAGSYTVSRGNWLDVGDNADVWVERTIVTGTLTIDGIGGGRNRMTSSRKLEVQRPTNGTSTCTVTVKMYDAQSGGNLLDEATIVLTAWRFY